MRELIKKKNLIDLVEKENGFPDDYSKKEKIEFFDQINYQLFILFQSHVQPVTDTKPTKISFYDLGWFILVPKTNEEIFLKGIYSSENIPEIESCVSYSRKKVVDDISNRCGRVKTSVRLFLDALSKAYISVIDNAIKKKSSGYVDFLCGSGKFIIEKGNAFFRSRSQLNSRVIDNKVAIAIDFASGVGFGILDGKGVNEITALGAKAIIEKINPKIIKQSGEIIGVEYGNFILPRLISKISDEVMYELVTYKGELDLLSLEEISVEQASFLASYSGCEFLTETRRDNPSMLRSPLALGGLKKINVRIAKELSKFNDAEPQWVSDLNLAWPAEYTAKKIRHNFSGIKVIDLESLIYISKINGHLDLSGLEQIRDEEAKLLSIHDGGLSLNGIKKISPASASFLSKMKGDKNYNVNGSGPYLEMNSLRIIDEDVCRELVKYKGILILDGLEKISDEVAEILSNHDFEISLKGVKGISEKGLEKINERRDDPFRGRPYGSLNHKGNISFEDLYLH